MNINFKCCIVQGCDNNNQTHKEKLFLTVPTNARRRKNWENALKIRIGKSSANAVCEDHFNLSEDSENWMFFKTIGTKICLKPDVVPHINLSSDLIIQVPSQLTDSARKRKLDLHLEATNSTQNRENPAKKILFPQTKEKEDTDVELQSTMLPTEIRKSSESEKSPSGSSLISNVSFTPPKENIPKKKTVRSIGRQTVIKPNTRSVKIQAYIQARDMKQVNVCTQTRKSLFTVSTSFDNESSPSKMSSSTSDFQISLQSSSSEEIDDVEVSILSETRLRTTIEIIETKSRFYIGLPKETYILTKFLIAWCSVQYTHILITLKKIRLNDVYNRLADDFGMSISNVSKIFVQTVPKLANVLQNFVFWPDTKSIKRLLPIPFRYRCANVQSIIDCLEIEIEKPSNPLKQSLTWSEYKKCNTIKYLISCTPNGFINFISGGFGGRISDKNIVIESGYLDHLPSNVSVMADRGFKQIDDILSEKMCNLIRPPSVGSKEILSKENARKAKRIAALRIHVERIIRRVREFEMVHMHSCVNNNLLHLMNHIMIIVCALINTQEPILK